MAEGRMLKRKITLSKKIAKLKSDKARLLWLYMLPFTDVEGRIEADTEDIRDEILRKQRKGYSLQKIEECLQDLHGVGLIILYTSKNSKRYLQFTKFLDEQSLRRDKEAKSQIPAPSTGVVREQDGTTPPEVKLSKVKRSKVIFKAPSLEDVKKYIHDNPELNNVDPNAFWKGFNDSGWIDTRGNPVRNWKLKLRTWSNYDNKRNSGNKTQRSSNRRNSYAEQESEIGETIE